MVMGMLTEEQLKWVIENDIEFYVFDLYRLDRALEICDRLGKISKIHLEIETGLNRNGLSSNDLDIAIESLNNNQDKHELFGVCSHLAGAESIANYYRIKKQLIKYKKTLKKLKNLGVIPKNRHISCSTGTIRYPENQFDMVNVV